MTADPAQPPRQTDPAGFRNPHTFKSKLARLAWRFVWPVFFRPTPPRLFRKWRNFLLRRFGAKIADTYIHPSVRIWAPWLLETGSATYIDEGVNLYNPYGITIADRVVISQGAFLCGATHDYKIPAYPLTGGQITVEPDAWIAAEAFVGPGVTIPTGTVVGARAVVVRTPPPWTVVAGNPAKVIKPRELTAPPPA
jgi:putative colanic acid biosynthesis acetyltransferase WcaF